MYKKNIYKIYFFKIFLYIFVHLEEYKVYYL